MYSEPQKTIISKILQQHQGSHYVVLKKDCSLKACSTKVYQFKKGMKATILHSARTCCFAAKFEDIDDHFIPEIYKFECGMYVLIYSLHISI